MGGLARRVSYAKLFKAKMSQIPTLVADSGYSFTDERGAHGELRPDVLVKDEWILKTYDQFPVDVVNVSAHELRYLSRTLRKSEFASRATAQPVLKRLVSANIVSDAPDTMAPPPFIVREVPARQATGTTTLRVAFVGLTDASPAPPRGFKFVDLVEAARRAVPEARKHADLVIALAYTKTGEASRLAAAVPGIDVIIVTDSLIEGPFFTPPVSVGQTFIVFTPFETRMLGELLFYREATGKYSARTRYITLDDAVPDDGTAMLTVNAARDAEQSTRANSKLLMDNWLARTRTHKPANSPASAYVSASKCAGCHTAQYIQWSNSAHAHAIDKLVERVFDFEASCLKCHATGQLQTTPGSEDELAKLQGVHCEQCHGPGSEHAAKPGKGYGLIANAQALCVSCHTADVSPNFDFQTAWAKIKH